jgi:hypothetical protein
MEAGAGDATARGLENLGPPVFLKGGADAWHDSPEKAHKP